MSPRRRRGADPKPYTQTPKSEGGAWGVRCRAACRPAGLSCGHAPRIHAIIVIGRSVLAENTWRQKLKRALTGLLPIASNREGECLQCGACCRLMVRCPFLKYDPETSPPREGEAGSGARSETVSARIGRLSERPGKTRCRIYPLRPPACRKYPRVAEEQVCFPCGYRFR